MAGKLARACGEARKCGVSQLVKSVHEEPTIEKQVLHADYQVQMPEHGLGHVAARVLLQLLAFDYVVSAKGISNNAIGHKLMEAVFSFAFKKEQPAGTRCTGLAALVEVLGPKAPDPNGKGHHLPVYDFPHELWSVLLKGVSWGAIYGSLISYKGYSGGC